MSEVELESSEFFDPYDDPRYHAKRKLRIPAIALVVLGVLSVAYAILASLMAGSIRNYNFDTQRSIERNRDVPPAMQALSKAYLKMNTDYLPVTNGLYAVCGALIAIGGYQMMNLSARWLGMTSAILSIVPFTSCCCCLGAVFGVWAMIILNMPDVKAGFELQARSPSP